jgi:hypothetical protein
MSISLSLVVVERGWIQYHNTLFFGIGVRATYKYCVVLYVRTRVEFFDGRRVAIIIFVRNSFSGFKAAKKIHSSCLPFFGMLKDTITRLSMLLVLNRY